MSAGKARLCSSDVRESDMDWSIRQAEAADADALALVGAATFLETFASVHTGAEIVAHCREEHSAAAYARMLVNRHGIRTPF